MHAEAMEWIRRHSTNEQVSVLDVGGRNINGTPRGLFPRSDYTVLDIAAGPNVDIVADAAAWEPDQAYDIVICAEVFEHTEVWRDILRTAYAALRPGGRLILTMAGPGRAEHSAIDGGPRLHPGEWYANIDPDDLGKELIAGGWVDVHVDQRPQPADVRATAIRG